MQCRFTGQFQCRHVSFCYTEQFNLPEAAWQNSFEVIVHTRRCVYLSLVVNNDHFIGGVSLNLLISL